MPLSDEISKFSSKLKNYQQNDLDSSGLDLAFHTNYVVCVLSDLAYRLKSTPSEKFLSKLFTEILIYSEFLLEIC